FKPYPASYGNSSVRMSNAKWSSFKGHCGHQHVAENAHGDPGLLPMAEILARAAGTTTPQEEGPMAGITKQDIYDAVWRTDAVPAPATAADRAKNPTWWAQSFLTDIGDKVRSMDARLTAQSAVIDKLVDAVAAGPGADLEALKREIRDAIASIDIHLTTGETDHA
ncbi:hypothetical protein ACWDUY_32155, partial [Streptomyces olivaceus]